MMTGWSGPFESWPRRRVGRLAPIREKQEKRGQKARRSRQPVEGSSVAGAGELVGETDQRTWGARVGGLDPRTRVGLAGEADPRSLAGPVGGPDLWTRAGPAGEADPRTRAERLGSGCRKDS